MKKIFHFVIVILFGIPILFRNIILNMTDSVMLFFKGRSYKKKYFDFLRMNNGRNFLCYRDNNSIEEYLSKNLEKANFTKITFVDLNDMKSHFKSNKIKIFEDSLEFPYLIKIRNRKIKRKPIYAEFYNALFIKNSKKKFIDKINEFFEL